jgi:transcriptional regulator GlxA family with amidase domain
MMAVVMIRVAFMLRQFCLIDGRPGERPASTPRIAGGAAVMRAVPNALGVVMSRIPWFGQQARCRKNLGVLRSGINVIDAAFEDMPVAACRLRTRGAHVKKIAFLVSPGFQLSSLSAMSVFEFANIASGEPVYEFHLLSERGGLVENSLGMKLETKPAGRCAYDTLIVGGGTGIDPITDGVQAWLRKAARRVRRLASICTGAFALAEAGLLDGRRVTTHWMFARELARRYPGVKVDEDRIFIADGSLWTSAGMTAGLDLALALVEDDLGPEIARNVARALVMYHRRAGGQSQFSKLLEFAPKSDRVQRALSHAKLNLKRPLSVDELAAAASLSPRQFSRLFQAETGQTPAKAVENLRVEAARLMMDEGRHPIEVIAMETGFSDRERMRRAFLRAFGQPPQAIQRQARLRPLAA